MLVRSLSRATARSETALQVLAAAGRVCVWTCGQNTEEESSAELQAIQLTHDNSLIHTNYQVNRYKE